jgi:hypothetical protein
VLEIRHGINALKVSNLGLIFFWQTVCKLATDRLETAWAQAQTPFDNKKDTAINGSPLIMSDDEMRAVGTGEHVVMSTKNFIIVAKVDKARETVDLDTTLAAIAHEFKILDTVRLIKVANESKVKGQAPLTKRVLENK